MSVPMASINILDENKPFDPGVQPFDIYCCCGCSIREGGGSEDGGLCVGDAFSYEVFISRFE